jgi:hypothetical protein
MRVVKNVLLIAALSCVLLAAFFPLGETVNTEDGQLVAERWSLLSLTLGSVFGGEPIKLTVPYVASIAVVLAAVAYSTRWVWESWPKSPVDDQV